MQSHLCHYPIQEDKGTLELRGCLRFGSQTRVHSQAFAETGGRQGSPSLKVVKAQTSAEFSAGYGPILTSLVSALFALTSYTRGQAKELLADSGFFRTKFFDTLCEGVNHVLKVRHKDFSHLDD